MAHIISVAGVKAGVGSTTLCINLALGMALSGHNPCVLSVEEVLPITVSPVMALERVIRENGRLEDAMVRNYHKIDILFVGGLFEKAKILPFKEMDHLFRGFSRVEDYDFVLVDVPMADRNIAMGLCAASSAVVLAINDDPSCISEAFAIIKALVAGGFRGRWSALINQCQDPKISNLVFEKLRNQANSAFRIDLHFLGAIQKDSSFLTAVENKQPLLIQFPDSPAAKEILNISRLLTDQEQEKAHSNALTAFLENCFKSLESEAASDGSYSYPGLTSPAGLKGPVWSTDALPIFNRIADNIAALAREVGALRHLVEHQGLTLQKPQEDAISNAIELDFDDYLSGNLNPKP